MTAVDQTEAIVAEDDRVVAFYAKGTHQRLVRRHGQTRLNAMTGVHYEDPDFPSVVVEFAPSGRIELEPGEGIGKAAPGTYADKQECARRGVDPSREVPRDTISWLRAHRGYNVDFYEEGNEPDRPQPTEEKFFELLTGFTLEFDVENLRGLVETEKATHNRPNLVKAAQAALDRTEQAYAEAERQRADAEASGGE